jgi:hypothetical protein
MFHRDGCPLGSDGAILPRLTEDQIHTLAVALAVLRDNIIERDGDLRLCPQIDELGDKILQSEWYRKVVLGVERK